jgi:hypothetical protein
VVRREHYIPNLLVPLHKEYKMKRLSLAVGLLTGIAISPCFGQTSTVEANIPFAFDVGNVSLPAGKYVVTQSNSLLTVRSADGAPAYFVLTSPLSGYGKPERRVLQFRLYGEKRFLSQVWSGDGDGRLLPIATNERELARNFAPGQKKEESLATNRLPK